MSARSYATRASERFLTFRIVELTNDQKTEVQKIKVGPTLLVGDNSVFNSIIKKITESRPSAPVADPGGEPLLERVSGKPVSKQLRPPGEPTVVRFDLLPHDVTTREGLRAAFESITPLAHSVADALRDWVKFGYPREAGVLAFLAFESREPFRRAAYIEVLDPSVSDEKNAMTMRSLEALLACEHTTFDLDGVFRFATPSGCETYRLCKERIDTLLKDYRGQTVLEITEHADNEILHQVRTRMHLKNIVAGEERAREIAGAKLQHVTKATGLHF